jgi:pyruvate,water dikinase
MPFTCVPKLWGGQDGIPCVTGVPEAVELIETGDILTVDGYQGIVIIEKRYIQKN